MLAGYNEYGVTNGLSGQAGSCRPESHGQIVQISQFQQSGDFLFSLRTDYDLRDEAVKSCVCSPGQPAEFVGINPFLRDELSRFLQESHIVTLFHITYTNNIVSIVCGNSRHPYTNSPGHLPNGSVY